MASIAQPDLSVFGNIKTVNDFDRLNQEFELKKRLAAAELQKQASGQNSPAAIQIVNEMERARATGDVQRYNLLHQVAKSFAIDRGMTPEWDSNFNQQPPGSPDSGTPPNVPQPKPAMTPTEVGAGAPNLSAALSGNGPAMQDFDMMGNPITGPLIPTAPSPTVPAPSTPQTFAKVGVVPGFADAAANIAATKKAAEKKAETLAGPIPEAAMTNIQETEGLASQLGSVNADLGAILKGIGGNDLKLGPAENAASRFKNWASMSDPNSQNYSTLMATLEQQRNASLLLAKGVQTEGDAIRAWNQLMTNVNDGNQVAQRLEEIMAVNKRSAELKSKQANEMRGNYGRPAKSFEESYTQPSSVTMTPSTQPANAPSKGAIVDGYVFLGGDPSQQKSWKKAN